MSTADSVVANMNPEERDALVDRLKGELQAKTEESAQLKARAELCAQFEEKERIRLGAFQAECTSFVDTLMEDGDADTNADLGPLKKWADGYLQNPDIVKQAPLARGFFVASAKLKRARDEASVGAKAGETLANTLKELEGVKDQESGRNDFHLALHSTGIMLQMYDNRHLRFIGSGPYIALKGPIQGYVGPYKALYRAI